MLHHSMIELPRQPMKPRRYDDRVGFFNETFEDYGSPKQEVESVSYITRWRLEKKDPKAAVSEPKKPIVFYIGREVPAKWRPWIKKGIEAWQPAFEKAGFKNAILAKEPPSPREDPDWDAEDARYSTIRWLPSTHRERLWAARPRPQDRRDPRIRHPHVSQRLEAHSRLVLRAGLAQRPQGPIAASARSTSWASWWPMSRRTKSATRSASGTT